MKNMKEKINPFIFFMFFMVINNLLLSLYSLVSRLKRVAEKSFTTVATDETEPHTFTLRKLIIWNRSSHRRTSALAYGGQSTEQATCAILSRWGASENTFKHLQTRHPLHYHPGFSMVESERQEIANPEIKEKVKNDLPNTKING